MWEEMKRNMSFKCLRHLWYFASLELLKVHSPVTWEIMRIETLYTFRSLSFKSRASCNPMVHASYSATSLKQGNFNCTTTRWLSPFVEIYTVSTPLPRTFTVPPKYNRQFRCPFSSDLMTKIDSFGKKYVIWLIIFYLNYGPSDPLLLGFWWPFEWHKWYQILQVWVAISLPPLIMSAFQRDISGDPSERLLGNLVIIFCK